MKWSSLRWIRCASRGTSRAVGPLLSFVVFVAIRSSPLLLSLAIILVSSFRCCCKCCSQTVIVVLALLTNVANGECSEWSSSWFPSFVSLIGSKAAVDNSVLVSCKTILKKQCESQSSQRSAYRLRLLGLSIFSYSSGPIYFLGCRLLFRSSFAWIRVQGDIPLLVCLPPLENDSFRCSTIMATVIIASSNQRGMKIKFSAHQQNQKDAFRPIRARRMPES